MEAGGKLIEEWLGLGRIVPVEQQSAECQSVPPGKRAIGDAGFSPAGFCEGPNAERSMIHPDDTFTIDTFADDSAGRYCPHGSTRGVIIQEKIDQRNGRWGLLRGWSGRGDGRCSLKHGKLDTRMWARVEGSADAACGL